MILRPSENIHLLEVLRRNLGPTLDEWPVAARLATSLNNTQVAPAAGHSSEGPVSTATGQALLRAALLPSLQSPLLSQSLGLEAAARAPVPSNQLLLSVAATAGHECLLGQARTSLLVQHLSQQNEWLRLHQEPSPAPSVSIPSLLISQAPPLFDTSAARSLSSSQAAHSFSHVSKDGEATRKALEALGSTLRQSSDPCIDVSFVQVPHTMKRTRGGGKFCFAYCLA